MHAMQSGYLLAAQRALFAGASPASDVPSPIMRGSTVMRSPAAAAAPAPDGSGVASTPVDSVRGTRWPYRGPLALAASLGSAGLPAWQRNLGLLTPEED
ncbi:hypothetical protein EON68_03485, partial [archaeon]